MKLYSLFDSIFKGEFTDKSTEEINSLITNTKATIKTYKKGETMLQLGDGVDRILLTVKGQCNIIKYSPRGKAVIVEELHPAQLLGLYETLASIDNYQAVVVANSKVIALQFSAEYIKESMNEHSGLSVLIAGYLAKLLSSTATKNQNTLLYSGIENLIIYLHNHCTDKKLPHTINTDREKMANTLNINLRTLYRYLDRLEQEGYIKKENRKIVIEKTHLAKMAKKIGEIV